MIERKQIESSILTSIGYDFESKTLEIELKKNKQIRQYHNFPIAVWHEFENTNSKGRYFLKHIKDKYDELRFTQTIG
ncbi:KTSC domain-containing protein [Flavivirga spongiicola]|uniref:KTSC domain-containing protein n=1 Tax=Flavivirga spongiicola TaxID=421621 RepID=A0ABU7XNT5_9FLAO|nr:KTSC domain-containing protein [Flavivirga sp. MEBiC05379]MDO5981874.1 KTSC domain-containing protein [Flavivirga sp. MEBiC05379]